MPKNGKASRFFKKVLVGAKKGAAGATKFARTYGPPTRNQIKSMAMGIQDAFAVRPPRPRAISKYGIGRN